MDENLSEALMMAGAILIFVIALTVSMSSFTEMRTQIDNIVEYDSRLDLVKDSNDKYLNYMTTGSDIRIVGVETIVSSIYRVAKENYIVYIKMNNIPSGIEKITLTEPQKYNNQEIIGTTEEIIEITINGKNSDATTLLKDTNDGGKGLYKALKDKKFEEYIGAYQEATGEGVNQANKTTYRVITYKEV